MCKFANRQTHTDNQTNDGDYVTFLAEVKMVMAVLQFIQLKTSKWKLRFQFVICYHILQVSWLFLG